ncbi:hypothetical protein [Pedobacter metabolipauper]|nr:hypothetical protein [Pedobacter metabolipauper]
MQLNSLKFFICALFICVCHEVRAQQFNWEAGIEKIASNGYYNLELSPEILAKTQMENLEDMRVYTKNQEIAHLIRTIYSNSNEISKTHFKVGIKQHEKQTVIHIAFDAYYVIDQFEIGIKNNGFYRRPVYLSKPNLPVKNSRKRTRYTNIEYYTISSIEEPCFKIEDGIRFKDMYLRIDNEDSSPLEILSINFYQQQRYLTAFFERDKEYVFKIGSKDNGAAVYDIDYFRDSIRTKLPIVHLKEFKSININTYRQDFLFTSKAWIWAAILILIALIGYITYRLIKDMDRPENGTKAL